MDAPLQTSLWLIIFAVIYGFIGAIAGYGMYYFAWGYDEDWKNSSAAFQVFDVICEMAVFALLAFWLSVGVTDRLELPKERRTVLEFVLGTMFLETLFVFSAGFEGKMQHIQSRLFGSDPDEL